MRRHIILSCLIMCSLLSLSQSFEIVYTVDDIVRLTGGDSNENGNYVVGNSCKKNNQNSVTAYAIFVQNDGDYVCKEYPLNNGRNSFVAAHCLDNGNAFVVGRKSRFNSGDLYDTLCITILNQELDVVTKRAYAVEYPYISIDCLCVTEGNNGCVIVASQVMRLGDDGYFKYDDAVYVFDVDGNMLNHNYYSEGHGFGVAKPTDITMIPDTDTIMLLGRGFDPFGGKSICLIDADLNVVSHSSYPNINVVYSWSHAKVWVDDAHFLLSMTVYDYDNPSSQEYASVFLSDTQAYFSDTLTYDRVDTADYTAMFSSLVFVNDTTIFLPTFSELSLYDSLPNDVVVSVIDKQLNMLGSKRFDCYGAYFRIFHTQRTNDGGCLMYGYCKKDGENKVALWKVMRDEIIMPLSVKEAKDDMVCGKVYPNPVTDVLNVNVEGFCGCVVTITLYDVMGRKMFEYKLGIDDDSVIGIDVSSLNKGLYMYKVNNGTMEFEGNFIKN